MKKNILIIGLIGILGITSGLMSSCVPDYETEFKVSTLVVPDRSQAPITFSLKGGEQNIEVQTTNIPFESWTAISNAEWCKLTKNTDKVTVTVDENNIYKQRLAEITISYGHQSYSITVAQLGLEPAILVGDKMQQEGYIKEIDAEAKEVTIPIATNLDLDNIVIPDTCNWVHLLEEPEVGKNARAENTVSKNLVFSLDQNTDTIVRYCTIILQSSQNYGYVSTFIIKQQKRGYIIDIEETNKNYNVKASGETITIPFKVNGPTKAYTFEIEKSAKDWIMPTPTTRGMRDANESFIIKPSTVEETRVGHITFRSTDPSNPNEFTVTVNQDKFIPVPPEGVTNLTTGAGPGFITLAWDMPVNINFTMIRITYYDKVVQEDKVIEINDNSVSAWNVENTFQCAGEYTFTVTTYGPTGLATEHPVTIAGTSGEAADKASIKLTVDMVSGNATEPTEGSIANLLDNNIDTYYHTMWSMLQPQKQPHYLQIDLKSYGLQRDFRFEYDGRKINNNGGDVIRANIWGSLTGADGSWVEIGTHTFTLPTTAGGHSEPQENITTNKAYKYIRFIPEARRNQDPLDPTNTNASWWNMSNIYLYKFNTHNESWAKKELNL